MKVPFFDLTRQYEQIGGEIEGAVKDVMKSGRYILGPIVERFERELADYCHVKHAVTCASGTDALKLAIEARLPEGPVDVPAFTFGATATTIVQTGRVPVFSDIDSATFLPVFRGGMPRVSVDLFGQSTNYWGGNIPTIQDQAQAIGTPVTGDAACLSFFPTKNLGCFGDGGAVLTDSDEIADKVRMLRAHGCKQKYHYEMIGTNSRLDAIQAAVLRVKLRYLDEWTKRRCEHAERYSEALRGLEGVIGPVAVREHVWNQYTVRIPWQPGQGRDEVKSRLEQAGIGTNIYYPSPLHLQPAFAYLGYKEGDFPNAEKACHEVLSLPVFPELREDEQGYVIETFKEVLGWWQNA